MPDKASQLLFDDREHPFVESAWLDVEKSGKMTVIRGGGFTKQVKKKKKKKERRGRRGRGKSVKLTGIVP